MVALDTNILVRYFTGDDPNLTQRARAILEQAQPKELLLDRLILAELSYVLRSVYKFDKREIAAALLALVQDERFIIPDHDTALNAITLFLRIHTLSFEDCWLLALYQQGEVSSVFSFDEGLVKSLNSAT